MSSSKQYKGIETLSGAAGYHHWAVRVEALLEGKGLEHTLTHDPPAPDANIDARKLWTKQNGEARSILFQTITSDLVGTFQEERLARQVWQGLKNRFKANEQFFRTVLHEIGHAIGFLHEQSRMDRDNYVKIFEENVNKTYFDNNFSKQKSMHDFDDIPYDYRSVMHYEMTSASINGENTIVPHKPEHTLEVGQDFGLSFTDIKLANLMYKCSEKCFNKPQCLPEGFVDKYCDCSCPIKYGPNCDYEITTVPACGGVYSKPVIIETPNYPDNPPPRTECVWEFKAPDGKNVTVNFQHFHLYERNDVHKICNGDQTHIRGGGFNGEHTYCGDDLNEKTLNIGPHENGTFVIFKFDESYDGIKRGFIANVTFV